MTDFLSNVVGTVSSAERNVACTFVTNCGIRRSLSYAGARLMDIRFISTLTAEDEETFAPALLQAIGSILDRLPIAYTVRIETTGARTFQHTHPAFGRAGDVLSHVDAAKIPAS